MSDHPKCAAKWAKHRKNKPRSFVATYNIIITPIQPYVYSPCFYTIMVYLSDREEDAGPRLETIKAKFSTVGALNVTGTALRTATKLGFGRQEIVNTIQAIERTCFFKSMTSHAEAKVWQDVYYVPHETTSLYVKFTSDVVTEFKLLSFKENTK
ncbi:MAG TPA: type II toxin-antitoxin system MqsR family toxin [Pseudolabrys sp.]|nr:type II toxin-antitoxin system MqsR family toxin [Pseudolabrys sp.]